VISVQHCFFFFFSVSFHSTAKCSKGKNAERNKNLVFKSGDILNSLFHSMLLLPRIYV
jgi:hypothetical protein